MINEFDQGFMTAIATLMAIDGDTKKAADVLIVGGMQDTECFYMDDNDKEILKDLNSHKEINLTGLEE